MYGLACQPNQFVVAYMSVHHDCVADLRVSIGGPDDRPPTRY
jgi:hypothetical protein